MSDKTQQSYEDHAKFVPVFHFVLGPLFFVNSLLALYLVITEFSLLTLSVAVMAIGLMLQSGFTRAFAVQGQDRVIRLEEQLRMERLLPEELRSSINDFTTDQLVALRFASDAELPGLAQKVLDDNIGDRKTIKQMIVTWRPDYQRL
jgi:hypothetical protein